LETERLAIAVQLFGKRDWLSEPVATIALAVSRLSPRPRTMSSSRRHRVSRDTSQNPDTYGTMTPRLGEKGTTMDAIVFAGTDKRAGGLAGAACWRLSVPAAGYDAVIDNVVGPYTGSGKDDGSLLRRVNAILGSELGLKMPAFWTFGFSTEHQAKAYFADLPG
jgi:hypothetical protein